MFGKKKLAKLNKQIKAAKVQVALLKTKDKAQEGSGDSEKSKSQAGNEFGGKNSMQNT